MKNKVIIASVLFASMSMHSQKQNKKEQPNASNNKVAKVDVVSTYERMAAKGYKTSPEMLLKVANACYYRSDLISAAKWYGELFLAVPEQEAETYYRYAQSLKAVNEFNKADEMMAVFQRKKT